MKVRTIIQWFLIAFVAWYMVTQPGHGMHLVSSIGGLLSSAAHDLAHLAGII